MKNLNIKYLLIAGAILNVSCSDNKTQTRNIESTNISAQYRSANVVNKAGIIQADLSDSAKDNIIIVPDPYEQIEADKASASPYLTSARDPIEPSTKGSQQTVTKQTEENNSIVQDSTEVRVNEDANKSATTPQNLPANVQACVDLIAAENGRVNFGQGCWYIPPGVDVNRVGGNDDVEFCRVYASSARECRDTDAGYFLNEQECVAQGAVWVLEIDNNRNSGSFGMIGGSCLTQQAYQCSYVQAGLYGQASTGSNSPSDNPAGNIGCWNRSEVVDYYNNPNARPSDLGMLFTLQNNTSIANSILEQGALANEVADCGIAEGTTSLESGTANALIHCLVENHRAAIDAWDEATREEYRQTNPTYCQDYIPREERAVNVQDITCPTL